jgi:hypothetical protein
VAELRADPWLCQTRVVARRFARLLARCAALLGLWTRDTAAPAVWDLGRRLCQRVAPRARTAVAHGVDLAHELWLRETRKPELPLYAAAVVAAVLAGWIVVHGI